MTHQVKRIPCQQNMRPFSQRVIELEQKLENIEADKAELENALCESRDALKVSDFQTISLQQNSFSNHLLLQNYKSSYLFVPR